MTIDLRRDNQKPFILLVEDSRSFALIKKSAQRWAVFFVVFVTNKLEKALDITVNLQHYLKRTVHIHCAVTSIHAKIIRARSSAG